MITMKIAICDDNSACTKRLHSVIAKYTKRRSIDACTVSEYNSGSDFLHSYDYGKYDIIFLDVKMPKIDGFDTAEKIREIDLDVDLLFVTNMRNDVQRGFDYNAKGYLYKDVEYEQVHEKLDRLINERLRKKQTAFRKIKQKNGGAVYLPLDRVLYFESQSHNITAVLQNEKYQFIDSITNLSDELKGFVRIGQSYLVNLNHIMHLYKNKAIMRNSVELTIGKMYKDAVNDAYRQMEAGRWNI